MRMQEFRDKSKDLGIINIDIKFKELEDELCNEFAIFSHIVVYFKHRPAMVIDKEKYVNDYDGFLNEVEKRLKENNGG